MFLKLSKVRGFEYLRIVESYRDKDKKNKHRTIINLGRADKLFKVLPALEKLFELYGKNQFTAINKINTQGTIIRNYSFVIIKHIWDRYQLGEFFNKMVKKRKIEFDFVKVVFSLVLNRLLLSELSKLGYYNKRENFLYFNEELKLQDMYKSLEILEQIKEELEMYLFNKSVGILNRDITVAFYDVTTLYFESKKEDELRNFGISKDFKMNEVQIVLTLLIDRDGMPITFEIYEGNKSEPKTLLDTLDRLKEKFKLHKITVVADRGISSGLNLLEIKKRGYEYVVSYKFKNRKIFEKMNKMEDYRQISFNEEEGYYGYKEIESEETIRVKVENREAKNIKYENIKLEHKIVSTYSDKRAIKDEKERNRQIEKINKKIGENRIKGNERYLKKYCNGDKICYELDMQKIEKEREYDGFYALASSDKSLSGLEIIKIHKNIYEIESAFRELKTDLNLRPIRHYKSSRIKGHITVSFLSYFILKNIEFRLKNNKKTEGLTVTAASIIEALNSINAIETDIDKKPYYLKSKHNKLASKMFDIFKIKPINNISSKEYVEKYIEGGYKKFTNSRTIFDVV